MFERFLAKAQVIDWLKNQPDDADLICLSKKKAGDLTSYVSHTMNPYELIGVLQIYAQYVISEIVNDPGENE